MNKRGQFTLVVILGVVVLGVIAYFVFSGSTGEPSETTVESSELATPVRNYVETCLNEVGLEALEEAALHGGYVDTSGFTPIEGIPYTRQEVLENPPGSGVVVPYWTHIQGDCSDSCFADSKRLPLTGDNSVQSQIEDYMNENIGECIDFSTFTDVEVSQQSEPSARVSFADGSVDFSLDYDIQISNEEEQTELSSFTSNADVDFMRIYLLSTGLNFFVTDTQFLDELTKNIVRAHSSGENPALPPVGGGASFEDAGPWTRIQVHERLTSYINDELSKVSLEGSLNEKKVITSNAEDLQNLNLLMPYGAPHYYGINRTDLEISFNYYPWWDLELDIKGPEGNSQQVFMPESRSLPGILRNIVPPLRITNYFYDVSYPVIVRVSQPTALNGEGFDFQFAVESNIFDNKPPNGTTIPSISVEGNGTYLCDRDAWSNSEYNVTAKSSLTGEALSDVLVGFRCGTESCHVGRTENDGKISSPMPICAGGEITLTSSGYGEETISVTTQDQAEEFEASLTPEVSIEARVLKKNLTSIRLPGQSRFDDAQWTLTGQVSEPSMGERAIIMLENVEDDSYVRAIVYNSSGIPYELDLLPGNYTVEGYLIKDLEALDEEVIIPDDEYCEPSPIPFTSGTCHDIEGIEFNQSFPAGALKLAEPVEITMEDLQKGEVTFYVASVEPSQLQYHADIGVLGKFTNITQENPATFAPVFSEN